MCFAKNLFSFCIGRKDYQNMQKDRFIGTLTLLYTLELVISAYIAFWFKWTLEDVAMRYGKVFINFQV